MFKVSPTLLDKFLNHQLDRFNKPIEDLIAYIKGEYLPTRQMNFGTLVHEYIETGEADMLPEEKEQLRPFYEMMSPYPKELYYRKEVFPGIFIASKVDQLAGNIIHEFKTGERFWGVDLFDGSVQWKIYCLLFESPEVIYHHFKYSKRSDKSPAVFDYSRFNFYAYAGMDKYIRGVIDDFLQFCELHNLLEFIAYGE